MLDFPRTVEGGLSILLLSHETDYPSTYHRTYHLLCRTWSLDLVWNHFPNLLCTNDAAYFWHQPPKRCPDRGVYSCSIRPHTYLHWSNIVSRSRLSYCPSSHQRICEILPIYSPFLTHLRSVVVSKCWRMYLDPIDVRVGAVFLSLTIVLFPNKVF